jgi:hypothetical protein
MAGTTGTEEPFARPAVSQADPGGRVRGPFRLGRFIGTSECSAAGCLRDLAHWWPARLGIFKRRVEFVVCRGPARPGLWLIGFRLCSHCLTLRAWQGPLTTI